jgi:hypothetical protein
VGNSSGEGVACRSVNRRKSHGFWLAKSPRIAYDLSSTARFASRSAFGLSPTPAYICAIVAWSHPAARRLSELSLVRKSRRLFDHASELAHQSTLLVDKQRRVFHHVHRQNGRDLHLRIRFSFGQKSNLEANPGPSPCRQAQCRERRTPPQGQTLSAILPLADRGILTPARDGMVQSISCRSEGEAHKRLHGEDCAESFGI